MKANEILHSAGDLYEERNKLYKDNYKRFGNIMTGFFPDGVTLKTCDDFNRFALYVLNVVKMTRYSANWETGHQDSIRDQMVYAAMLEEVDDEISQRANGRAMGKG